MTNRAIRIAATGMARATKITTVNMLGPTRPRSPYNRAAMTSRAIRIAATRIVRVTKITKVNW